MRNRTYSGGKRADPSGRMGTTGSRPGKYSRKADLVQTSHPNLLDHEKPTGKSNDKHATAARSTSPARPSPAPARRVESVSTLEGNIVSPSANIPPECSSPTHGKVIAEYATARAVEIEC